MIEILYNICIFHKKSLNIQVGKTKTTELTPNILLLEMENLSTICKIYTIQCQCHIQYKSYFRNEEITSGSVITYTHCSTFPFQRELLSSSPCFSLRGFFRAIT